MNSIYWLRIYHVLQHIVCIRTVYEMCIRDSGEYPGSADASEYRMEDGTKLSLSAKDQVLLGLKDTFKF